MSTGASATTHTYLSRLRLDAEPPSTAALFRLHRAHVELVPYETMWIPLGERWGIGIRESVHRIAHHGRGGYCFHLNGALGELLRSLGYHVDLHVGGVHGPDGPGGDEMTNHLVLTVRDLPTDDNPGGTWYVDVGLGDALHEPLPLIAGTYDQPPFRLVLEETPRAVGDWHLTHDPRGTFAGMSWRSAPAEIEMFGPRHVWLSTAPESGFVKVLTVQRRDATGVDMLRGLTLQRVGSGETTSTLTSRDELVGVLRSLFTFDVDAIGPERLDALWSRVHHTHVAWEAAGRP